MNDKQFSGLIIIGLVILLLIAANTILFEDGSFITLGLIKGCLPLWICNR